MSTDPRFAEPTPFATAACTPTRSASCGDACLTVSLAGSLFFQSPTGAARGKVLLYLLITMAPFAIVAPVLGPALDRRRAGAALLVIVVGRGPGRAVHRHGACTSASRRPRACSSTRSRSACSCWPKGYSIAKSALVPALVKDDAELVNANSRLALISVIAATVGGAARGRRPAALRRRLVAARSPRSCSWSAAILAIQIPQARAASPTDERRRAARTRTSCTSRASCSRAARWPCSAAASASCAFFAAFSLKNDCSRWASSAPRPRSAASSAWSRRPSLRRSMREEVILASSLVLPAVFTLLGALRRRHGRLRARRVRGRDRRGGRAARVRQPAAARRPRRRARSRVRPVRDAVPAGVGDRRARRHHPVRAELGLFLLAVVLGFAAVSYVAALRAARSRAVRTKLLPDAVDRAITRSRERAVGEVRSRFRRGKRPDNPQPEPQVDTQPDPRPPAANEN